jgi:hypothetical protein
MSNDSTSIFWFEKDFDGESARQMLERNWVIPICAVIVYIGFVFAGQAYMKNRPAYKLQTPMFLWNLGLAIFSIAGTVRVVPFLFKLFVNDGLHVAMCQNELVCKFTIVFEFFPNFQRYIQSN